MRSITEIQRELTKLAEELEQLQQSEKKEASEHNWQKLSTLAYRYPIKNHPLSSMDSHEKKSYLTILLSVANLDDASLNESLLMIHKIAFGCGYLTQDGILNDEFINSKKLDFTQLDEISRLFGKSELRLLLVMESLLLTIGFKGNKKATYEYIFDLCVLLNITKKQLIFLSNMARAISANDVNEFKCKIRNEYSVFDCYICNLYIERKLITLEMMLNKHVGQSIYSQEISILKFMMIGEVIKKQISGTFAQFEMVNNQNKLVAIFSSNDQFECEMIELAKKERKIEITLKSKLYVGRYNLKSYSKSLPDVIDNYIVLDPLEISPQAVILLQNDISFDSSNVDFMKTPVAISTSYIDSYSLSKKYFDKNKKED